jgi:translation initiation factor 2 alpha subunit (eIF-2alpha)
VIDWDKTLVNWASGLIGGVVGGLFTALGVLLTLNNDKTQRQRLERKRLKSALLGLRSELESNWQRHKNTVGKYLSGLKEGHVADGIISIEENYFSIYEGNAVVIGEILDDEIRNCIIESYTLLKGHVDSLRLNNSLIEDIKDALERANRPGSQDQVKFEKMNLDVKTAAAIRFTPVLMSEYKQLTEKLEKTIPLLKGYAAKIE